MHSFFFITSTSSACTVMLVYLPLKGSHSNNLTHSIIFHGEPEVAVLTSSTSLVNMPDLGVSLSIPQQALTLTDQGVELMVHPCLAGPFELPTGCRAVSPVYYIQQDTREELQISLTLRIQHWAYLEREEDCENLMFLMSYLGRTTHTDYRFKQIAEATGKFRQDVQYGEITLRQLGFIVVAKRLQKKMHIGMMQVFRL